MNKTYIIVGIIILILILFFLWNNSNSTTGTAGTTGTAETTGATDMPESFNCTSGDNINTNVIPTNTEDNSEMAEIKKEFKKKMQTRNQARDGYKHDSYLAGKRGGCQNDAVNFIDESNDLLPVGQMVNDQFAGVDENKGQYAPYKQEKMVADKYKPSEIFNSNNYLPSEGSHNPDWWDKVPEPVSVKNRHLINVTKPIGVGTVGSSLRNPSYDIRGSPACPKFVISPWQQSTIQPDNNLKPLC